MRPIFKLLNELSNNAPAYFISSPQGHDLQNIHFEKWFQCYFDLYQENILKHKVSDFKNSADILLIKKDPDKKSYLKDDFLELKAFQETSPMQLNHKFCLIFETEYITENIFNMLLKILEEPQNSLTFFLFSNLNKKLLPTIESRVSKLRLTNSDLNSIGVEQNQTNIFFENLDKIKEMESLIDFQRFYTSLKKEDEFFKGFLQFIASKQISSKVKSSIPELMKWFQESKTFNNSSSERSYFLYQILKLSL